MFYQQLSHSNTALLVRPPLSPSLIDMRSIVTEELHTVTPTTAKALLDAGYEVHVERSMQRIFDDEEFEKYNPLNLFGEY